MSLALFRLGRFSYRHPLAVITTWIVLLLGVGGLVLAAGGGTITSAITIDGTKSQAVLDELRGEFPQLAGGQGSIVFTADDGQRLDRGEHATELADVAAHINANSVVVPRRSPAIPGAAPGAQPAAGAPHPLAVDGSPVPGVLVSGGGTVAVMQLQFTSAVEDLPDGTIDDIVTTAKDQLKDSGITVLVTESLKPHTAPLGGSEALGIAFAALVLILALGSIRAAILPLATAISGVAIGLGTALGVSNSIEMTSATPVLALMIGLAVGMDYALFIVNRTRRLMIDDDLPVSEAVPRSVGTAGSAVTFAGLTVVIALTGLSLIGISFLTTMALVAAGTVVMAVAIALTALPALMRLVGERLVSPRARQRAEQQISKHASEAGRPTLGRRWVVGVIKHRGIITAVIAAGLLVAAIPAASMTFGMSDGSTANLHTDERKAFDAVADTLGPGYNAPLLTVVTADQDAAFTPTQLPAIATALGSFDGVDTVQPMGITPDGSVAMLTVIPSGGPTAQGTETLVHELRDHGADRLSVDAATGNVAAIGVAGLAAINIDISEKLADVLPYYIAIIVILSLIVLTLVFRSILVPLKATVGFLLTIGATFGIITAVFQWGWLKDLVGVDTTGPILSFLPIMVTGILYGLAMDYEMFLVTSMRESHAHGATGNNAVIGGYTQASRVVVAAAIIMISVFAGFVLSDDPMVKQFGLALAIGITIDAFLIRLTLVPALMSYLGDKAWWMPRWMHRIMPHLDIEGARLHQQLETDTEKTGRKAPGKEASLPLLTHAAGPDHNDPE